MIHQLGVVQRDVSTRHVLRDPNTGKIRLIDFDCAIRFGFGFAPGSGPGPVRSLGLPLRRTGSVTREGDDERESAEQQVWRSWMEREDAEVQGMLNDHVAWD